MGIEIERKFLVLNDNYKQEAVQRTLYRQAYLSNNRNNIIRARVAGEKGFITIKGQRTNTTPIARLEFEYEIPLKDANTILQTLCKGYILEKYRYIIPANNNLSWEVDEFLGENHGLVIAEIELKSLTDSFEKPEWIGKEVSAESRYLNSNLFKKPFKYWINKK